MKIKGFSLKKVLDRRTQLYDRALRTYAGARIIGDTVTDIVDDLVAQLPDTVSRDAVYETIRPLAGDILTEAKARELAWRIAGNIDQLLEGRPIHTWTQQLHDEAVPVRIERMRPARRKDVPGWTLFCRVLAGSPCPLVFPQFMSSRSCSRIARTLGFSAPWHRYPYSTPLHFVNLMFIANLEAAKSDSAPYFQTISNTSALVNLNRGLIEVRCRARPCPRGYAHPCEKCWVGYNECPAGIYPKTLVMRVCASCLTDAYFEPTDDGNVCINCRGTQHNSIHR